MSAIEKIIKIAANSSFNNNTVNLLNESVLDLSNNLNNFKSSVVLKSDPTFENKVIMNDLSANDVSFNKLTVGGVVIDGTTFSNNGGSGAGATEEQISQIETNKSDIQDISSNVKDLSNNVTAIINNISIDIQDISQNVRDNSNNILSNKNDINSLTNSHISLTNTLNTNSQNINTNASDIASLETTVDSISTSQWTSTGGNKINYTGDYVGIGNTNPTAPLHVKSNINEPIATFEGASDTLVLIKSNSSAQYDEVGLLIKGKSDSLS